jgi:multicomponent K+:H+ antiporter subunit D
LLHSTFSVAALFLVIDLVIGRRPGAGDGFDPRSFNQQGLLAAAFFVTATMVIGLPPWSGFLGKLQILGALKTTAAADWPFLWGAILGGSALVLVGFAQAGSRVFWKTESADPLGLRPATVPGTAADASPELPLVMPAVAIGISWGMLLLLTAFPGPLMSYIEATSEQLFDPQLYIQSVLSEAEGLGR